MKTFFISDLHLDENQPEIADIFFRFLKKAALEAEKLYILGDFFEAWIGDDDLSPFNISIINALRAATQQGLAIYFQHGNRDFLLGKKFLAATGAQLLADEHVVNLYGTPVLLMHGDTLCTLDVKYLKFRKKSRTWLYKTLVSFKSLVKRRQIVANMRAASKAHTSTTAYHIMDVTQSAVEEVMQKHHVKYLIHGHTHREAIHHFELNAEPVARIVLGAWHERGCVLIYDEMGKMELIKLE